VARRMSLALGVSLLLGLALSLATARPETACGVERWAVKTLTDPAATSVNYTPKDTTVDALRARPAPPVGSHTTRLPGAEKRVFRVRGVALLRAKLEDDGDIHLVIADPSAKSHTMIVELPDRRCTAGAPSIRRAQMRKARNAFIKACGDVGEKFVKLTGTATIRGVGFFHLKHGQSGAAPNGIELQPVLGFKSTDCARPGATLPAPTRPPPPAPPSPAPPPAAPAPPTPPPPAPTSPAPPPAAPAPPTPPPPASPSPPPPPPPPPPRPPSGSLTVAAVGDIHPCSSSSNAAATAIVAASADLILGLGDYQYDTGILTCYNANFDRDWGPNVPKTYPVLAPNHDQDWRDADPLHYWNGAGASGYRSPVTLQPHQSYSFDRNGWHFIAIDDSCYRDTGQCSTSALLSWAQADLAAHTNLCTIAYWHQPYWTSPTSVHNRFTDIRPVVDALHAAGVDIVLQAHNHDYERFAPQTPADVADPNGIRAFVVGTGGNGLYSFTGTAVNSVIRQNTAYGVLMLTLSDGTYSWQFARAAGGNFSDSGTGVCH